MLEGYFEDCLFCDFTELDSLVVVREDWIARRI